MTFLKTSILTSPTLWFKDGSSYSIFFWIKIIIFICSHIYPMTTIKATKDWQKHFQIYLVVRNLGICWYKFLNHHCWSKDMSCKSLINISCMSLLIRVVTIHYCFFNYIWQRGIKLIYLLWFLNQNWNFLATK